MADSSKNLAKNAPKEFEKRLVPPQVQNPTISIDPAIPESIKTDITNLSGNRVAFVEEDLLYGQFVQRLKEFFEEQDATNAKADIDDKLTTISAKVDGLSTNKENLKGDVNNLKPEELIKTEASEDKFKLSVDNDFVQHIVENVLGIINYDLVVNTTIEEIITNINSLIDGNANEFKEALNNELNKGLELSKFKKMESETSDDLVIKNEKESEEDSINEQQSTDIVPTEERQQEESVSEEIPGTEEKPPLIEDRREPQEKNTETPPKEQTESPKKSTEAKSDKNLSDFELKQKNVELQRKKKMLEVDKQLDRINNVYLKKLIESQDIVEEYDARKANTTNSKKKKKGGKSDSSELFNGKRKISWSKLGIGLGIGALVALWVLFRGYSRHERVKKYIEEHKKDKDSSSVNSDLASEISIGDKETLPLEQQADKVEGDLNEAIPLVDKSISDIEDAKGQLEEKYGDEDQVQQPAVEEIHETVVEEKETILEVPVIEQVQESPPADLDERQVQQIFEESHDGIDDAMLDSMDASLAETKTEIDDNIASNQENAKKRNSEITTMLSDQQERLAHLSEQLEASEENVESESNVINDLVEASKEVAEETKDFDEKKNKEKDENVERIKENREKAEQEAKSSAQEIEESHKEGEEKARDAAKQNEENRKKLEERNQEMSKTTVPKTALDEANNAAKEVSAELESSTNEMSDVEGKTLENERFKTLEKVEEVDSKTDELADKSNELSEDVTRLEKDAEVDSQNSEKVDAAAQSALKERELLQAEYDTRATGEVDRLFRDYLSSDDNQTKNDNLIMMDKQQLSQFYSLIHNTKNLIAQMVIKNSEEKGFDSIKFEAEKCLDFS